VAELWPLNPAKITVERDTTGRRKVFKVEGDGKTYDSSDILHIPGFGYDGLRGLSPIQQARQALGTLSAREEYEGEFYANSARPDYFLTHPGQLSKGAKGRIKDDIDAKHRRHGWRPSVLEEGMTVHEMGMPLKDQQFVEMNQFSATQVAVMFDVPPSWIGGATGDSLEYKTVEGQALNFVKFKKTPRLVRIERTLRHDKDLFPDRTLFPKFNVEGLLRGDSAARSAFYTALYGVGAISSEEIRDEEDYGPKLDGDHYQETPAGTAPNANGNSNGNGNARSRQLVLETPGGKG
jgi:HK97 family phage portal protein